MSRGRTTGLSAGEAVLGLVIEHSDHGYSLERRLDQRFGAAQFGYSTAYSALRRMEKEGLVRAAGGPAACEEVVYEATPDGVEHFRRWLRAPTSVPVLREELHAKIALCEPRDLPRLIDVVHMEELACIAELDRMRESVLAEHAAPRSPAEQAPAPRSLAETPWPELMDRGVIHAQASFWGGRIKQLGQLRAYLEELRPEAERRALQEHRHRRERQQQQQQHQQQRQRRLAG